MTQTKNQKSTPAPSTGVLLLGPAPRWLIILAACAALAVSLPLIYLGVRASELPLDEIAVILARPRVFELALNTISLCVSVSVTTVVLGTLIATILTRVKIRAARTWLLLSALPLAVPSYLASFGWLVVSPGLNGFWPSWMLLSAVTVPYVILPVAASLRGSSAQGEAVARTLGKGPLEAFMRVTWPQVRPAAIAGGLLVFLYSLSDFGLVAMLRFETLTWGVQQAYSASFDRAQAAILALLLVAIAVIVVGAERSARGTLSRSTAVSSPREGVGFWASLLFRCIVILPVALGLIIPMIGLLFRLFEATSLETINVPRLFSSAISTIGVSIAAGFLATLFALPLAALAARYRGPWVAALEGAGYLSNALPGIVVGLSLVFFSLSVLPVLYQTVPILVFAYAVLFMPKALGTSRASIESVSPNLVAVARTLGASPLAAWWKITVRLALPGLGVGALLVVVTTMKELPATLMLSPIGFNTLATEIWSRTASGEFATAAPFAAALVLIAAIPAMILSGVRSVAREEM